MEITYDQMFKEYAAAMGFTADDFKIDKEKAVSIMEMYHEGQKETALQLMYVGLKYYITRCIRKYAKSYLATNPSEIDELETSCFFAVSEAMPRYDPEYSLPTTYFDLYIRGAITRHVESELCKTTVRSHSDGIREINRAIQYFESNGITNWNSSDISMYTGLSIRVVEDRLRLKNIKDTKSIEEHFEEMGEIESRQPSVESQVLDTIVFENIFEVINTFSPMEKDIVLLAHGFLSGKPESMASISKYLETNYKVSLTGSQVTTLLEKVQKKIGASKKFKGLKEESGIRKDSALKKVSSSRTVPEDMIEEFKDHLLEDTERAETRTLELKFKKFGK